MILDIYSSLFLQYPYIFNSCLYFTFKFVRCLYFTIIVLVSITGFYCILHCFIKHDVYHIYSFDYFQFIFYWFYVNLAYLFCDIYYIVFIFRAWLTVTLFIFMILDKCCMFYILFCSTLYFTNVILVSITDFLSTLHYFIKYDVYNLLI